MNEDELKSILEKHKLWLEDNGGERADLSYADLSNADLRDANLYSANLYSADLSNANLRGADLSSAVGNFILGYFGKHHAIAAGGYICIGCERHTYQDWIENGIEIGKKNKYTDEEIQDYMDWIKLAIHALERIEKENCNVNQTE